MSEKKAREPALDWLPALRKHGKGDLIAGFMVFLIALPLSLGIALASGFPAIAGVFTAIIAGVVVTFFSGAPLTIKGPAAGLIAIAVASVSELGGGDPTLGYRRTLAVIVVAGLIQIGMGLLRAGRLGDFFPGSAVHGMLAAIGVIIIAKQVPVLLGVTPHSREPLELLMQIPETVMHMNPEIAGIGLLGLVVLVGLSMAKHPLLKKIPAPLVVLAFAIPMGLAFDLEHHHTYSMLGASFELGPESLVGVPDHMTSAIVFPDWSVVATGASIKYVVMFALVGTLESLLTARAIDGLDPNHGHSMYDRDIVAIGVGNTLSGMIGGLPMISEIVRSKANLDNGVKSRFANFFHGLFLLVFVAFLPWLIHRVPLSALAAMLVFTGARLASPKELIHAWKLGKDQAAVFAATLVVTLATDLLVGVGVGIVLELLVHVGYGAKLRTLFRPAVQEAIEADGTPLLLVNSSATFASYLPLKERIYSVARRHKKVIVDLSHASLIDHTTQERLRDLEAELADQGMKMTVRGMDGHALLGALPTALRRSVAPPAIVATSK